MVAVAKKLSRRPKLLDHYSLKKLDHYKGLRRCWWHVCKAEAISPENPARLPLLFELDAILNIRDGFHYVPATPTQVRIDKFASDFPMEPCPLVVLSVTDFKNKNIDGRLDGFGDKKAGGSGGSCGGCGGCGGD
jgi:hypothetical protein